MRRVLVCTRALRIYPISRTLEPARGLAVDHPHQQIRSVRMKLTFIRKNSNGGQSPTLYRTDRGTFVVQGFKVSDEEALSTMELPDHETAVEVPAALLAEIDRRAG
jgi:hypothetical protein